MSIKMIALDLDGTTLNSEGHVSAYTREVLEKAISEGVHVVVSTGRVFNSIPEEVLSIRGLNYAISSNGAVIRDVQKEEIFYGNFLAETAVDKAIELAKEYDMTLEAFWDGRAFIDVELLNRMMAKGFANRNLEYVLKTRTPVNDLYGQMKENIGIIENMNFFFSSTERLEEMRPYIMSIPDATVTQSFKFNLEVGGPTTSKRNAIETLISKLGIEQSELMCCGDAPNDIEMIKFAGLGVAMGNAWGETKEYADYVTDTNDEDGVAKAVEKFVL